MSGAYEAIAGDPTSGLLLIGDHASNRVPDGIELGVPADVMTRHVALDIGVAPLGRALCAALGCPGVLGGVSRLVIDYNREVDEPSLIPAVSDGDAIPGNAILGRTGRATRIARYWQPFHAAVADRIAAGRPRLLVSLHSFTPRLATSDVPRPWQVGILYNHDERAPRIAIPLLEAAGVVTGNNEPYSGRELNSTMDRHGEGTGTPYLAFEVRQDLIGDDAGVAAWADVLAPVIARTLARLGNAIDSGQ